MKKSVLLALALFIHPALAGPTVVYVSESGDNRIAIFTLDEKTGDLTRIGAIDLSGSPGSLATTPRSFAPLRGGAHDERVRLDQDSTPRRGCCRTR